MDTYATQKSLRGIACSKLIPPAILLAAVACCLLHHRYATACQSVQMGQDALDLEAAMIYELPQDAATTQRYGCGSGCVSGTGTTAETPAWTMSSGSGSSTSSLFSSTSSLTDDDDDQRDDATSSPPGRRPVSSSSSSSSSLTSSESSDKMQMDGAAAAAAAGPLYELSTMLDNLPAIRFNGLKPHFHFYMGRDKSKFISRMMTTKSVQIKVGPGEGPQSWWKFGPPLKEAISSTTPPNRFN